MLKKIYFDYFWLSNRNFTVNVYKRKWSYGGATVEYSGLLHDCYERINSSRPINQALQIEVSIFCLV